MTNSYHLGKNRLNIKLMKKSQNVSTYENCVSIDNRNIFKCWPKTLSKPSFYCDIKIYLMHGLQIFIAY